MKTSLNDLKKGVNPYGISYESMKKGRYVVVDIPVSDKELLEVEGTITQEIWLPQGGYPTLQINLQKQNNLKEKYNFSKGLYAVYAEKVKRIYESFRIL
jgi:hypothetical protein